MFPDFTFTLFPFKRLVGRFIADEMSIALWKWPRENIQYVCIDYIRGLFFRTRPKII